MSEWYPKTDEEVQALPIAPNSALVWYPVLGVGQVLQVNDEKEGTITLAGKYDGRWVRVVVISPIGASERTR
jgi:hypothetical protein